jgi:hypothetical protein
MLKHRRLSDRTREQVPIHLLQQGLKRRQSLALRVAFESPFIASDVYVLLNSEDRSPHRRNSVYVSMQWIAACFFPPAIAVEHALQI